MDFKVKGHSKYNIKLLDSIVVKSSDYRDDRLYYSAIKQKNFKSNYFETPKIHDISDKSFSMEYVPGKSFNEFLEYASKDDLDFLTLSIKCLKFS